MPASLSISLGVSSLSMYMGSPFFPSSSSSHFFPFGEGRGEGREGRELAPTTAGPSSSAFALPPAPPDWFAEKGISTVWML